MAGGLGEMVEAKEELQAQFMQATEVALQQTMDALKATSEALERIQAIVLWLSKQQWKQENDQTWEGLLKAYEAEMNPEPLPELPSRAYRVGK